MPLLQKRAGFTDGTCPRTSGSAVSGTGPAQSWSPGTEPGITVQTRPVLQFTHRELPPHRAGSGRGPPASHRILTLRSLRSISHRRCSSLPGTPPAHIPSGQTRADKGLGGSKGVEQSENQCSKAQLAHIPRIALPQLLGHSCSFPPMDSRRVGDTSSQRLLPWRWRVAC